MIRKIIFKRIANYFLIKKRLSFNRYMLIVLLGIEQIINKTKRFEKYNSGFKLTLWFPFISQYMYFTLSKILTCLKRIYLIRFFIDKF